MMSQLMGKAAEFQKIRDSPTIRYYTKWWRYLDYLQAGKTREGRLEKGFTGLQREKNIPTILLSGNTHIIMEGPLSQTTVSNGFPEKSLFSPREDGMLKYHAAKIRKHIIIKTGRGESGNRRILFNPPAEGHEAYHVKILVGEKSSLNLEIIQANREERGLNTITVEASLEKKAELKIYNVMLQSPMTPLFYEMRLAGEKESKSEINNIIIGGRMSHIELNAINHGAGSTTRIKSIAIAPKETFTDHITNIMNEAPFTKALVSVTGFGTGGYLVHQGTIKAGEKASESINRLTSIMLPLNDEGTLVSVPKLEVANPTVTEGSHSSSISRLREDQLFYLSSRGLGKEEAQRLILVSSIADILDIVDSLERKLEIAEEILSFTTI